MQYKMAINQAELKKIVLSYLRGEDLLEIKVRLHKECRASKMSCKLLYKLIKITARDPLIADILGSLNIKKGPNPWADGPYEKLMNSENLYVLLTNLCHDGHRHVNCLLTQINNTTPPRNWSNIYILAAISSTGLGVLFYLHKKNIETMVNWFTRTLSSFTNWAGKTFSITRNIPLLGIAYTNLELLWNLYNTFAYGTTTTTEKWHNLLFKIAATAFNIYAYVLSYFAAGAITIPAAIVIFLSSSIEIVQSIFNWLRSQALLKALTKPDENADAKIAAEYERAKHFHQLDQNTVWVKISAATLITIATAIWNLSPPGLLISMFSIAFISLVIVAKWSIQASFDEANDRSLQTTLQTILNCPKSKNSLTNLEEKGGYQSDAGIPYPQREMTPEPSSSSPTKILRAFQTAGGCLKEEKMPPETQRIEEAPVEPITPTPAIHEEITNESIAIRPF